MRPRRHSVLGRAVVSGILSVALVLFGPGTPRVSYAQTPATPAFQPTLDELVDRAEGVRDLIDRSAFDRAELGRELAFHSPEELLAWVRESIAFEQYRGLLRGPGGTLAARAGNAFDQSVLLAGLIIDAGYEARVLRGHLPAPEARALVLQMAERRPVLPPLDPGLRAALEELQHAGRGAASSFAEPDAGELPEPLEFASLVAAASSNADSILEAMAGVGTLQSGSALSWLAEEAQEYSWVEYRTAPGAPWTEAHPAFATPLPPSGLDVLDVMEGVVPPEHQHRLRIDITIEQKLGEELRTHVLLDGWERPVANLNGVPITITNVPWSFGAWEDLELPLDHVLSNGVFVTLVMGEVASGLAFDTNGTVVPLAEAATAAAELFQTLGGGFERAGGALGALGRDSPGDPEDFVALTAQWIDYTLIEPGGDSTTYRRTVLDRIGPEARARGSSEVGSDRSEFLPLMGARTAMIATGGVPGSFALDRQLETLVQNRGFFEALGSQATEYRPEMEFAFDGAVPVDAMRPLDLFRMFDLATTSSDIAYRAVPTLVVIGESYGGGPDEVRVERFVDVITNAKRVLIAVDDDLVTGVEAAIRAGVWDTVVEGAVLDRSLLPASRFSTPIHVGRALAEGRDLVVYGPADVASVASAGYGAEATAAMATDLQRGFWVVVPPPDVVDDGRTAWWRVRPETGETLGVVSDGRGGNLTAYQVLLGIGAALMIALMVRIGIEHQNCKDRIRGEAGARLELENPREYERQSLACSYSYLLWAAVLAVDDELTIAEERCRNDFLLSTMVGCQ